MMDKIIKLIYTKNFTLAYILIKSQNIDITKLEIKWTDLLDEMQMSDISVPLFKDENIFVIIRGISTKVAWVDIISEDESKIYDVFINYWNMFNEKPSNKSFRHNLIWCAADNIRYSGSKLSFYLTQEELNTNLTRLIFGI